MTYAEFLGFELKPNYFRVGITNLQNAESLKRQQTIPGLGA